MEYPKHIIRKMNIALEKDDIKEGTELEEEVLKECLAYEIEVQGYPNKDRALDLIVQIIGS